MPGTHRATIHDTRDGPSSRCVIFPLDIVTSQSSTLAPLGGISPIAFMTRYWQRRAHLVRDAVPDFNDLVTLPELRRIAGRDDVEARVVVREGTRWHLEHGPFSPRFWRTLPASRWTLLVQGLNHTVPAADALLQRFAFIPYARLDDVMVSYAAPGGGVGPHVDSYDVFLLQGHGLRQWRISTQRDQELDPRAPLKILRDFRPRHTWTLATGDMLYLPPHVAHDGVALEACTTYSIGFRAPRYADLIAELFAEPALARVGDALYRDPGQRPTRHPAAIPPAITAGLADAIRRLRFSRRTLDDLVGGTLSTPKANIVFDRPAPAMPKHRVHARMRSRGVRLDVRSLMLYHAGTFYINGERLRPVASARATLRALADERALLGWRIDPTANDHLYDWYRAGWLHLANPSI